MLSYFLRKLGRMLAIGVILYSTLMFALPSFAATATNVAFENSDIVGMNYQLSGSTTWMPVPSAGLTNVSSTTKFQVILAQPLPAGTYYQLYLSVNDDFGNYAVEWTGTTTTSTSSLITGYPFPQGYGFLPPSGTSIYEVVNPGGASYYTAIVPNAPTGLSISSVTSSSALLTWSAVAGASSYSVYLNGAASPRVSDIVGTSYGLSGLSPGETYSIAITASDSNGESAPSTTVSFITKPSAPIGLTISSVTATSATISWSATPGASSYDVYLDGSLLAHGILGTSFGLSGLSIGSTHSVTVSAVNNTGDSLQSSPLTFTTETPVLVSPTGVHQSGTPGGIGTISWTGSTNAPAGTTYTIYDNGQAIGTTTTSPFQVQNYDPNAVYTVVASAPNYQSSQPVSQYGTETGKAMTLGFSPLDLIQNSAALVASVGSLLLLVIVVMFAPRLIRLVRRTNGGRKIAEWDYFDPNSQEWVIDPVIIEDTNVKTKSVSDSMVPDVHSSVQDRQYDYRVNTERNFDKEIR